MIVLLLVLLILLWFFGYLGPGVLIFPNIPLFVINNQTITLFHILVFILLVWALTILPQPFRIIAGIILLFWLLSTFGFLLFTGLPSILVIVIIIVLALSLLRSL